MADTERTERLHPGSVKIRPRSTKDGKKGTGK